MEFFTLKEDESYIELNNLMKVLSWVTTGGEAKNHIDAGKVFVNGKVELRRRNKLRSGDMVQFEGDKVFIQSHSN